MRLMKRRDGTWGDGLVMSGGVKKRRPTANTAWRLGRLPRGFVALITAAATIWPNQMYRYDESMCMLAVSDAGARQRDPTPPRVRSTPAEPPHSLACRCARSMWVISSLCHIYWQGGRCQLIASMPSFVTFCTTVFAFFILVLFHNIWISKTDNEFIMMS